MLLFVYINIIIIICPRARRVRTRLVCNNIYISVRRWETMYCVAKTKIGYITRAIKFREKIICRCAVYTCARARLEQRKTVLQRYPRDSFINARII